MGFSAPSNANYCSAGFGIDFTNPAVANLSPQSYMSAVCMAGANMVNLVNAKPATVLNGPWAVVPTPNIGPAITRGGLTTTNSQFTDPAGANTNQYFTTACISQTSSLASIIGLVSNSSGANTGWRIIVSTTGQIQVYRGSTQVIGGTAANIVLGEPYLIIVSNNPQECFCLSINLNTGTTVFNTVASSVAPAATTGVFVVGNDGGTPSRACFGLSRVMWSYQWIKRQEALKWIRNPWAFWHPSLLGQGFNIGVATPSGGAVVYPYPPFQLRTA